MTSARHRVAHRHPPCARPTTLPCSTSIRPALPINHSMFGSASSARLHPAAVDLLVGLRARRPDRRPAAAVEQLELDAGRVDRAAHQPAERIDLANEMALGGAADRRIARHVRDGVGRQRAQADVRAEARRRVRGFTAGVARADHDDVERLPSRSSAKRCIICRHRSARRYARATSSDVRRPVISSSAARAS